MGLSLGQREQGRAQGSTHPTPSLFLQHGALQHTAQRNTPRDGPGGTWGGEEGGLCCHRAMHDEHLQQQRAVLLILGTIGQYTGRKTQPLLIHLFFAGFRIPD